MKKKKNFSSTISSQQISGKNFKSKIKPAMKKFLKNLSFGVDGVGSAADNAIFKNRARSIECSFDYVACPLQFL